MPYRLEAVIRTRTAQATERRRNHRFQRHLISYRRYRTVTTDPQSAICNPRPRPEAGRPLFSLFSTDQGVRIPTLFHLLGFLLGFGEPLARSSSYLHHHPIAYRTTLIPCTIFASCPASASISRLQSALRTSDLQLFSHFLDLSISTATIRIASRIGICIHLSAPFILYSPGHTYHHTSHPIGPPPN